MCGDNESMNKLHAKSTEYSKNDNDDNDDVVKEGGKCVE